MIDEQFGQWLVTNNLSDTNQAERAAAMWAMVGLWAPFDLLYQVVTPLRRQKARSEV